jgi:hypothetical protein
MDIDVYIATENIKNFSALLLSKRSEIDTNVLVELLRREQEKLAAAIEAQAKLISCKNNQASH